MDISMIIMGIIVLWLMIWFGWNERKQRRKQFKQSKIIGDIGENIVCRILYKLDRDNYIVRYNVYFGRAQIDHLVMCIESRDIFVIETKRWSGIITGKGTDKMWTQNKNGVIKYLDNPIMQNKFHCREVKKCYKNYEIHNVVVFVGNATLNIPKSKCIVDKDKLIDYIEGCSIINITTNMTTSKVSNKRLIDI